MKSSVSEEKKPSGRGRALSRIIKANCVDCENEFEKTVASRQLRCKPCAKQHKRNYERETREERNRKRREERKGACTVKPHQLVCGHTVYFRNSLMDGEEVPCERCDDWQEYVVNVNVRRWVGCRHRMTKFNTVCIPGSKKTTCRKCFNATEFLMRGRLS